MRHLILMIFGIFTIVVPVSRAEAYDIVGFPGSTWGQVTHDFDDLVGTGSIAYINQGVDWVVLPGGITLNTYAEFRYRLRTKNDDFYDAYGPDVGLELRRSPFRLGIDYYWQRYPELSQSSDAVQYYLSWYYDWDLMPKGKHLFGLAGFSGSTWGQVTHDVDSLVGTGSIAYINQGVDWVVLPGGITLSTYAEFRYRLRTKNDDFYDAYGPDVGLELRRSPFKLGIDYYWQRYPGLSQSSDAVQLYLTWYYDWDLKPKKKKHD
jgi:hypothetical protein